VICDRARARLGPKRSHIYIYIYIYRIQILQGYEQIRNPECRHSSSFYVYKFYWYVEKGKLILLRHLMWIYQSCQIILTSLLSSIVKLLEAASYIETSRRSWWLNMVGYHWHKTGNSLPGSWRFCCINSTWLI